MVLIVWLAAGEALRNLVYHIVYRPWKSRGRQNLRYTHAKNTKSLGLFICSRVHTWKLCPDFP